MATDEGQEAVFARVSNVEIRERERLSNTQEDETGTFEQIRGFEKMPLVTLEEAVRPLIAILPRVEHYATEAKNKSKDMPMDPLTHEEAASIILYTMECKPDEECLYRVLNATLRRRDRQKLTLWFLYLKLFIRALKRLPSVREAVFRGVNGDMTKDYSTGETVIWWGFSSCTTKVNVLNSNMFLKKSGERTMFTIFCNAGKDISRYSAYKNEAEVLLLPGRQFIVESCLKPASGLNMIQLRETKPDIELLEGDASTVLLMIYQESLPVFLEAVILKFHCFKTELKR